MLIESNGHTSAYNQAIREMMEGLPESFREKSRFGKGLEEDNKGYWERIKTADGNFAFVFHEEEISQDTLNQKYGNNGKKFVDTTVWDSDLKVWSVDKQNPNGRLINLDEQRRKNLDNPKLLVSYIDGEGHIPQRFRKESEKKTYNVPIEGTDKFRKIVAENDTFNGVVPGVNHPIDVNVWYRIPNLTEHERKNLHFIQVLWSNEIAAKEFTSKNPKAYRTGKIEKNTEKGTFKLGFVDGGVNSLVDDKISPWYREKDNNQPTWERDSNNFVMIPLSDNPGFITFDFITELNFESYIVIADYNFTGKIKILSVVKWGFKKGKGPVTETNKIEKTIVEPVMVLTDKFSPMAQTIWDQDYGKNNQYQLLL